MFENLENIPKQNAALAQKMAHLKLDFAVEADDDAHIVSINEGTVQVRKKSGDDTPSFTLSAPKESWATFLKPTPPPGFHDIMAMSQHGHLQIDGDHFPYQQNILTILTLFTELRQREN